MMAENKAQAPVEKDANKASPAPPASNPGPAAKAPAAPAPVTKPEPKTEAKAERPITLEAMMNGLRGLTVAELAAVINTAEDLRDEKREEALHALREKMKAEADELGVSIGDLFPQSRFRPEPSTTRPRLGRPPSSGAHQPIPAKFRGPNGEEWSGRGRTPTWFQKLKDDGQDMAKFLINKPNS